MKITDLVADFADLISKFNEPRHEPEQQAQVVIVKAEPDQEGELSPLSVAPGADSQSDDIRRFRQIVDLANGPGDKCYDTRPDEAYASIEAVTTDAGGGWNNPKAPSDIRVQHPSMYPGHQHGAK
jgi:hypothetical protein